MSEGVDYSYSRPDIDGLVKAKKKFVIRYVTPPSNGAKGLDQAEFTALKAAGLQVVVVWEGAAKDTLGGRARGVADAKAAQQGLNAIDKLDDRLPVYFAIDWDANPIEMRAVQAYFDGVISVLGVERVGVYAGATQLQAIRTAGKAKWYWQTVAWSKGIVLSSIHLYQYRVDVALAGGKVDFNKAMSTNYGQKPVTPKAPEVSLRLAEGGGLSGYVHLSAGTRVVSGSLTIADSNGRKTTVKVAL